MKLESNDPPFLVVEARARLWFDSANPSTPFFKPSGPFDLTQGNTLRVVLVDFPEGSTLTSLALTSTSNPKIVIEFPPSPEEIFSIVCNQEGGPSIPASGLIIGITDVEDPPQPDTYQLALNGEFADGTTWNTDPEVINMPGG